MWQPARRLVVQGELLVLRGVLKRPAPAP